MKNKIKISVVILAAILTGITIFIACNKEEPIQDIATQDGRNSSLKGKVEVIWFLEIGNSVVVEGNFHRNIYERPRDGKICDCIACFGICVLTPQSGLTNNSSGVLDYDIANKTATLYFIKDLEQAEEEFVVDEPIFISKDDLSSNMVSKYSISKGITILPKVYEYKNYDNAGVIYGDDTLLCYGKTQLNIQIE